MEQPLVDICIPTWNTNPEYFRQAIESALAQTETRWRIYIHDDASTTDMDAVVKPYLKDPRISWHPNRTKLGIGGNWNATARLGSAPYVQFLFPDDWWNEDFLEKGLKVMEAHPNVGMVSFGHSYVCDKGDEAIPAFKAMEKFRVDTIKPGVNDGKEILRMWLNRELHPNVPGEPEFIMLRRSIMEKVGPYLEDMPQNLDTEYSLRCLNVSDWFWIPETCGYFRVHDDAASSINQREGKGVFDRFRCFEELLKHTTDANDRALIRDARNRALTDMARKFLNRVSTGKNISGKGGGAFKKFVMQHPFLIARALWKAKTTKA